MFSNIKSKLNAAASAAATITDTAASPSTNQSQQQKIDFDRATREQLLAECKQNQAQLLRYKQRLSDVVQAYKGLQKEKQALEASLQAITPSTDEQSEHGGEGEAESASRAEERVAALATALATLTQEKNVLQAGLVEDKRRMAQQHKEAILAKDAQIRALREELTSKPSPAQAAQGTRSPRMASQSPGMGIAEKRQLQNDLLAARQEVEVLQARIGGLGKLADMESLSRALDQERERANKLDAELSTLQLNFTRHRQEAADELHRVQAELREMSELYGEVEAARAAVAGRVGVVDRELSAVVDERDELAQAARAATAHADTLRAELADAMALLSQAQQQAREPAHAHPHAKGDLKALIANRAEELAQCWRGEFEARAAVAEAITAELRRDVETHQATLAAVREEYEQQVAELQDQVAMNRTRAVALLDDKEREIADLRLQITRQASQSAREAAHDEAPAPPRTQSPAPRGHTPEMAQEPLLHQVQLQLARDRELAQAVRARTALKEQLDTAELQIETQLHTIRELEETIHEYRRAEKRDNLSMEYFKNILLKYLAAPANQQPHLARAICALLQLDPQEASLFLTKMKVT